MEVLNVLKNDWILDQFTKTETISKTQEHGEKKKKREMTSDPGRHAERDTSQWAASAFGYEEFSSELLLCACAMAQN